ncbi:CTLH, C-terminal LisH motif-containing protein [Artemisia annua]|uniref:CTLH, C-terminal LisH motif-containing protein n=1 Tax=Artemisia annua TaxID=35608 RepID=A0A2U1KVE4_ARTAN|nr:CTLH, C-terminal LisH motif-containing protein [Artemisia annua]
MRRLVISEKSSPSDGLKTLSSSLRMSKALARSFRLESESGAFCNVNYIKELVFKGDWDNLEKYLAGFIRVGDNHYSVKMLSEFLKQKYLEALDNWLDFLVVFMLIVGYANERAKALNILNEELKVLKPFDGELFLDMTNLLMIENIRYSLNIYAFLYHYRKISVFWENAQLSTYTDDVTARGVLASELKKLIEMNPELRHKCQLPTHQLCQNPNSDPYITSILVDHSCGPQNAAQGQLHVANEFSSIRRSGGLQLANNVNEVDGSVSLMNVEAQAECSQGVCHQS